jgi:hypothetical protein
LDQLPVGPAGQDLGFELGTAHGAAEDLDDAAAPVRHLPDLERLADLRAQLEREREGGHGGRAAIALSHGRKPRACDGGTRNETRKSRS